MKVSIVGMGYVGLVSGVGLAEIGHDVLCVDVDADKVARVNRGEAPIFEEGLTDLLKKNIGKRLRAVTDLSAAVDETDLTLICVGTPSTPQGIDLSYVLRVCTSVGEVLRKKSGYHVVAVKSTVVPGTTDGPVRKALEAASGKVAGVDFGLGMNPEFLREGEAVRDFMEPDRVVVGGVDDRSRDVLARLYAPFGDVPFVRTTNATAEMIKYTANSLLATLISFSNEIANFCSRMGNIDATEVMGGVYLDRRIALKNGTGERKFPGIVTYLKGGCGYGGSCFPKDVRALIAHASQLDTPMRVLSAVEETNRYQPMEMILALRRELGALAGKRVALLGLSFKPGTDDIRESPALEILSALDQAGAVVSVYDPQFASSGEPMCLAGGAPMVRTLRDAVIDAEAVLVVTAWPEFTTLPQVLNELKREPFILDGRRIVPRQAWERYEGIGWREQSADH